jgi:hypothetical protein
MNYAWAHSICNNTKNNFDFITFNSNSYKLYDININYVINTIFDDVDKYDKYIRNELTGKIKNAFALDPTNILKLNSKISTENRLNFILYHLNNGNKFLGTPITDYVIGGSRRKRISGGTLNKDKILLILNEKKEQINHNTELLNKIQDTINLIETIQENNIFFYDCFIYINQILENENINIDDINDFNEYLKNYVPDNINNYRKNIELFNHIKKIERHPTYKLLKQFLLHILDNDYDFDLTLSDYENDDGIDIDNIKTNYIKFFDFNSNINTSYLNEIFEQTKPNTRLYILFLINHFKKIFINNIDNDENKFYEICHMYFILDISYGLLYKDNIIYSRIKKAIKAAASKPINTEDFKLSSQLKKNNLSIIKKYPLFRIKKVKLSTIKENNLSSFPIKN